MACRNWIALRFPGGRLRIACWISCRVEIGIGNIVWSRFMSGLIY